MIHRKLPRLNFLCRRVDPEDILQDSYLKAWKGREKFDGENLLAFMWTITDHTIKNAIRDNRETMKRSHSRESHPTVRGDEDDHEWDSPSKDPGPLFLAMVNEAEQVGFGGEFPLFYQPGKRGGLMGKTWRLTREIKKVKEKLLSFI